LLTTPSTVVQLLSGLCGGGQQGQVASHCVRSAYVGAGLTWSLQVVAYLGGLVRPIVYYALSRSLRKTALGFLRRRQQQQQHQASRTH
jgi:hypothetical protein